MGTFSIWHWAVVIVLLLLLFGGRGKISGLMGDFAQGIRSFRNGLRDEDVAANIGGTEQKAISASDASNLRQRGGATPRPS